MVTIYPDTVDTWMLPPPVAAGTYPQPLTPMSIKALYGAVPTQAPLPPTPGTYVVGADSDLPIMRQYGEAMRDRRGRDIVALPGGHDLPLDDPEGLAALLLAVADATD